MEKQTLNHRKRIVIGNGRNQGGYHARTKMVRNLVVTGIDAGRQTEITIPGSKMAPKAFIIISDMELGNPYTLLKQGMEVVKPTNGVDGTGNLKKQMPARNGWDRGFYLSLKGR